MKVLTAKQALILVVVRDLGMPGRKPPIRLLGLVLGLAPATVHKHLFAAGKKIDMAPPAVRLFVAGTVEDECP